MADNSVISELARQDKLYLLPKLYGEVHITPTVEAELSKPRTPEAARELVKNKPEWLKVQTPKKVEAIPDIHPGEMTSIALAKERGGDTVFLDDKDARTAAQARGLKLKGVVGIYNDAAHAGIFTSSQELDKAHEELLASTFRIKKRLLKNELSRFQEYERAQEQTRTLDAKKQLQQQKTQQTEAAQAVEKAAQQKLEQRELFKTSREQLVAKQQEATATREARQAEIAAASAKRAEARVRREAAQAKAAEAVRALDKAPVVEPTRSIAQTPAVTHSPVQQAKSQAVTTQQQASPLPAPAPAPAITRGR